MNQIPLPNSITFPHLISGAPISIPINLIVDLRPCSDHMGVEITTDRGDRVPVRATLAEVQGAISRIANSTSKIATEQPAEQPDRYFLFAFVSVSEDHEQHYGSIAFTGPRFPTHQYLRMMIAQEFQTIRSVVTGWTEFRDKRDFELFLSTEEGQ